MRQLLATLLVLALVVVWCIAVAGHPARMPAAGEAPPDRPVLAVGMPPASWPQASNAAHLDLSDITAVDGHTALVGGTVHDGLRQHNALFLTLDGGASWRAVGPSCPGARTLAINCAEQNLWVVSRSDGSEPQLHSSSDTGRCWISYPIPTGPHCTAVRVLPAGAASATVLVDRGDGNEQELRTGNAGQSWAHGPLRRAPSHAPGSRSQVICDNGWGWRLVDGRIERRDPVGGVWLPTAAQPVDDYGQGAAPQMIVKRQTGDADTPAG